MKLGTCARGLLAGAVGVMALAGGSGVAHAQPEVPEPTPPVPGIIDQLLTETPDLFVDPRDEGGPSNNWGGVGMYCENLYVRCR